MSCTASTRPILVHIPHGCTVSSSSLLHVWHKLLLSLFHWDNPQKLHRLRISFAPCVKQTPLQVWAFVLYNPRGTSFMLKSMCDSLPFGIVCTPPSWLHLLDSLNPSFRIRLRCFGNRLLLLLSPCVHSDVLGIFIAIALNFLTIIATTTGRWVQCDDSWWWIIRWWVTTTCMSHSLRAFPTTRPMWRQLMIWIRWWWATTCSVLSVAGKYDIYTMYYVPQESFLTQRPKAHTVCLSQ